MNLLIVQENQYDLELFTKFFASIHFLNPCYSNHLPNNIDNFDIIVVDENTNIPNNYTKYIIVLTNNNIIENKNVFSIKKPINWKKFTQILKDIYEMNEWTIINTQEITYDIVPYQKKDVFMINYYTNHKGIETFNKSLNSLTNNIPMEILDNIKNTLEEIALYFNPFNKKVTAYISSNSSEVTLEIKNNLNFVPFFAKSTSNYLSIEKANITVRWNIENEQQVALQT